MRKIILYMLCISLFAACDNRRPILEDATVWTRINIDWSDANISPNGASVWIFPHNGKRPTVLLTNSTTDSVRLSGGNYSILVFNETVSDHNFIAFRGTSRYEIFEAYAKPITVSDRYVKSNGENMATTPNILAVQSRDLYSITNSMIAQGRGPTLTFAPKRVVSLMEITVHVKGLDQTAKNGHSMTISGMAEGVNLSTGRSSVSPVTHLSILGNKKFYSESTDCGTMSAAFFSFGLTDVMVRSGRTRNIIRLYFKLRDGSEHSTVESDVTDMIEQVPGTQMKFNLNMGNADQPNTELPEVPDANLPDSGFDADVSEWGDNVDIEVPV